jgi:hypothetical protein
MGFKYTKQQAYMSDLMAKIHRRHFVGNTDALNGHILKNANDKLISFFCKIHTFKSSNW